ncbi:PLP-dependent aminotransferase family protein [uncultured Kordia sp.]|uniref:aminotransferase-like domain-containing protein n=1 Tax=uncultured Kordia sp. TaxID=507699 RepID=UPI0026140015|nr:PLP-dependent aminotransferase family protein [uncultured Kordia sp.]
MIKDYNINQNLSVNFNNAIGFLNGIQFNYPEAISFLAGQPDEDYFNIEANMLQFNKFVEYRLVNSEKTRLQVINAIGQYNKTAGIINDILVKYVHKDYNITVDENEVLVTVGAQEAFAIIVSTICNIDEDIILVENPGYVGLSSFAKIYDYSIKGIAIDEQGINLEALEKTLISSNEGDKKVKLVYVIPDHQNPSGVSMPTENRLKLLALAEQYNFLIVEDSVYNNFSYEEAQLPTLKSLDTSNRVIYVGSFSKSLFPGLRIGFILSDQIIENSNGENIPLIQEMTKVKSQTTNNTPSITQAILGGILVDLDFSLRAYNTEKLKSYKNKLQLMLSCLDEYVGNKTWSENIFWTKPKGGFFIKMKLPFTIDKNEVIKCAKEYNVLFCPMSFFYLDDGGTNELRLTFSNVAPKAIRQGVKNLSNYLKNQIEQSKH